MVGAGLAASAHGLAVLAEKSATLVSGRAQTRPLAHATHERLCALFFPPAQVDTLTDTQRQQLTAAKVQVWETLSQSPQALDVLTGLWFDPFLSGAQTYVDPSAHFHALMRHVHPALFFRLRFHYLSTIYDTALGEDLADNTAYAKPVLHPQVGRVVEDFRATTATQFNPGEKLYFDPHTQSLRHRDGPFDYVIIGSGTGGSVLAHELSRAGKRVLVLEQGSFFVPGSIDGTRENAFYESRNLRFSDNGQILVRSAQIAGGGSSINVDLAFPPTFPAIIKRLERWRELGWMTYTRQEIDTAYEWVECMLGTRQLTAEEMNLNNRALWDGSQALGWEPSLYRLNRHPEDASPSPATSKISSLERLLIPALRSTTHPLYLQTDAQVLEMAFAPHEGAQRATALRVRQCAPLDSPTVIPDPMGLQIPAGTEYTVEARHFILAAGALGSPALLLRSGAETFNPNIGKGVVLHPSMPVLSLFDTPIHNAAGLTASVFNAHFVNQDGHGYIVEAMDGTPGYAAPMVFGSGTAIFDTIRQFQYFAGFGPMLVDTSDPVNRVRLDANGNPVVDYRLSAADAVRFRRAIASAAQIAFAAGARRVAIPSLEIGGPFFADFDTFAAALEHVQFLPHQTVITSAHLQASLSMGNDPNDSATDPQQRLLGTTNVFVADASVFPESIGANPMQSISTFAKLLADKLLKRAR